MDQLVISGAREHNLKDVTVAIPRDSLTVITGLSGSGKSSLAFDTIYAEGQRRYVESLSAYARQFLGQMDKPDVDSIEGLSPAISIDQKTTSRNPRSTVGTVTEIYDYLRLLWARIGHPHCHVCGRPISGQSAEQIIDQVMELPEGTRFMVLAPIVRGRKGEFAKQFEELRAEGFGRVKVNGELRRLDEEIVLDKKYKHDVAVVVDRLVMKSELRKRLADSIETAVALADGLVEIELVESAGADSVGGSAKAESPGGGKTLTFSEKFACPVHGPSLVELEPRIFSFNAPHGACPRCTGLGSQMEIDPDLVVPDPTLSIGEGAIAPWAVSASNYYDQLTQAIAERYDVDLDTPWQDLPRDAQEFFLFGTNGERIQVSYRNRFGRRRSYATQFEGIVPSLERRYRETDSDYAREKIEEYMTLRPCPDCKGARLRPESRAVLIDGTAIHEFTGLPARRALQWIREREFSEHDRRIARLVLREIEERLQFLENVGIGYLSMDRASATLSGGEAQRIRLATQIGSSLVGVLYILDEPSIGLHQRDNDKLIATLERLRNLGNTVLVVEHDEGTMRAADHIVDMGPAAGEHGGHVVAEGTWREIAEIPGSLTGQFLAGTRTIEIPDKRRRPSGYIGIEGAAENNLRGIDVKIPLGVLSSVTGVSGSGKSTLVNEVLLKAVSNHLHRSRQRAGTHKRITGLDQLDKIISVDQSPIGRTPRSNPATYIGLFDQIRELFSKTQEARARGYKPGRFSFNVKGGRCEVCRGDGQIKIEMHFLPDVYVPCEQCHGKRYNRETLEVRFKGKTIADVLEMPIEEALEFFAHIPKIRRRVQALVDVGLGYMRLGQPATTLSGGEAQRVKLAAELSKVATGRTMYILDEPTTGLHFADIQRLLEVLDRLVEAGNSVVVIEHNLDVIKVSDRLIDLGPEGGDEGGQVIAQGTPEEVAADPGSHTGHFLAGVLPVKAERGRSARARTGSKAPAGTGSRATAGTGSKVPPRTGSRATAGNGSKMAANGSKTAANGSKTAKAGRNGSKTTANGSPAAKAAGNGSGSGGKTTGKPRRRTAPAR
ncbi:MAG TPA: excinuclease ABC subunit UvrA [Solirubrobacteraceae bacterium]|jgi:excinuclease ABC subunit A|nr:excinuclease ABC subunit UvrA [Solirubrobacteraceae bacterium]